MTAYARPRPGFHTDPVQLAAVEAEAAVNAIALAEEFADANRKPRWRDRLRKVWKR